MINLTREEAQQVLDALKHLCLHTAAIKGYDGEKVQPPIDMLKAKLKQPKNEFNPDWDVMAVMVEEQQRMAKRIEELTQLVTSQGIRLMDAEAQPEPEPVAYTTGHCKENAQPGGGQLHNLYCGYPVCDRKAITAKLKERNT